MLKQKLILLINKFIGQIKSLFSCFANKFPFNTLNKIISELHSKYIVTINNFKSLKSLNLTSLIKKIKSNQFIANFLLGSFGINKDNQNIPDGLLGISITNKNVVLAHVSFNPDTKKIHVHARETLNIHTNNNNIDLNLQSSEINLAIANIIKQYLQANNLQNITGACVLTPTQYVITLMDLQNSKQEALSEKAIFWSIKDYINYSIDDAVLDYFMVPAITSHDNVQRAYAVAMRAKLADEIGNVLYNSGINLKYIDINELSIRNIMSLYPESKDGSLVLVILDDIANIMLIKDNCLFISRNTKLDIKALDCFDPSLASKDAANETEKIHLAEQLSGELQRSIDYANNMLKNLSFSNLSVLPCRFNLDSVINWLADQLNMPINKLDLAEKIKFDPEISKDQQYNYMLAIGAALREMVNVTTN